MEETVRNQADAARISTARAYAKAQRKQVIQAAIEQGVVDVINWGEFPVTQKLRKAFSDFERRILQRLKANKWTEAEGRALCIALEYFGILEDLIERAKTQFSSIQEKNKREA